MPDHHNALDQVRRWLPRRTYTKAPPAFGDLAAAKDGARISVILPARDEAETISAIVTAIREQLMEAHAVVDEILVIDSRSRDATAAIASAAGAVVHRVHGERPDGGKGEAMRLGLEKMSGDIGVFLDADVRDLDLGFVTRLIAPLLEEPGLMLVKGYYKRPVEADDSGRPEGGGRVTELVARPLIRAREPRLSGFIQPLSGEVAFRREGLVGLRFVSGYGVDLGILLQVLNRHGLDAMAQADLGQRLHGHQDLHALGRMALQVAAAFDLCLEGVERVSAERATVTTSGGRPTLRDEKISTWILPSVQPSD